LILLHFIINLSLYREDIGKESKSNPTILLHNHSNKIKNKVMAVELITKEDLNIFKMEVINEIKQVLKAKSSAGTSHKEWLKSYEVRKLLDISPGTLQNMRINGSIPFTQIGGLMYYNYDEIMKVLEQNKNTNQFAFKKNKNV
jgi:hypothetical protein